jgi:hypothetical protein
MKIESVSLMVAVVLGITIAYLITKYVAPSIVDILCREILKCV